MQSGRNFQPNPRPPGGTPRGRFPRDRSNVEMTSKNVTCFNCREKGHMAATCPKAQIPKNVRMVTNQPKRETDTEANPWTRVLTLKDTVAATQGSTLYARSVGPAYKVNITVEGIPTRAFLDHGSQVTIVRRQLLPMILKKNAWSTEKCKSKNIPLKAQPVGAMGKN